MKIIQYIFTNKIIHYGEIYRLISFNYFIKKLGIDLTKSHILDIGFNRGTYRWYFKNVLKSREYSGVEIDKRFLKKYSNTFYHNLEHNIINNTYDIIFCSHVLEHVKDDYTFLLNMAYSLGDVGKVLIRVPTPTNKNIYFRSFNKKTAQDEEHFRDGYNLDEIKQLLSRVGLKVENHFCSMGRLGFAMHTFFEILRDYQIRFQRLLQLPFIFISIIDIYFVNNKSSSDLLIVASKV